MQSSKFWISSFSHCSDFCHASKRHGELSKAMMLLYIKILHHASPIGWTLPSKPKIPYSSYFRQFSSDDHPQSHGQFLCFGGSLFVSTNLLFPLLLRQVTTYASNLIQAFAAFTPYGCSRLHILTLAFYHLLMARLSFLLQDWSSGLASMHSFALIVVNDDNKGA